MWYQRNSRNKYRAVSSTYNGVQYHSKAEAAYAAQLDLRVKARDIKRWERQIKCDLRVNGYHITNYYVDFKVFHNDGSEELIEVKGMETPEWVLKRKLLEATLIHDDPNLKYTVVKV
jgi:hypothetical protein